MDPKIHNNVILNMQEDEEFEKCIVGTNEVHKKKFGENLDHDLDHDLNHDLNNNIINTSNSIITMHVCENFKCVGVYNTDIICMFYKI